MEYGEGESHLVGSPFLPDGVMIIIAGGKREKERTSKSQREIVV